MFSNITQSVIYIWMKCVCVCVCESLVGPVNFKPCRKNIKFELHDDISNILKFVLWNTNYIFEKKSNL